MGKIYSDSGIQQNANIFWRALDVLLSRFERPVVIYECLLARRSRQRLKIQNRQNFLVLVRIKILIATRIEGRWKEKHACRSGSTLANSHISSWGVRCAGGCGVLARDDSLIGFLLFDGLARFGGILRRFLGIDDIDSICFSEFSQLFLKTGVWCTLHHKIFFSC